MARGARAASPHAYRGKLGRTTTEIVHVTGPRGELIAATVHTAIDAVTDPELAERLFTDDPARALNIVRADSGEYFRASVPVVYHDPAAELLVLVLTDAQRHRELDERIVMLERLRDDPAAVPPYAKDFTVVFGAVGLHALLEHRAAAALGAAELQRQHEEIARQHHELERMRAETRARVLATAQAPVVAEPTNIGPPPSIEREDLSTKPVERQPMEEELSTELLPSLAVAPPARIEVPEEGPATQPIRPPIVATRPSTSNGTNKRPRIDPAKVEYDEEETTGAAAAIPQGSDPLTTETTDLPPPEHDAWLDFASTGVTSSFDVKQDRVRLALIAGEQIARGLTGPLDIRVLLHRVAAFPVVAIVIGPPAAMRVPTSTLLSVLTLDIGSDLDRTVLVALAKSFELQIDVIVRGRPLRRVRVTAPLAENVAYILRAADDHLRGIAADGEAEPNYSRARDLVVGAGYDLLGTEHAEHGEFRDDKLTQLETAQHVRRAIATARRFARPSREDYLVTARSFPLVRWRELRLRVVEAAVAWGIWMGPELAQVAVSEGLARSRRDLIMKLDQGFEKLKAHPSAFDLDSDAAEDNLKALGEEARALGVDLKRPAHRPSNGAIKSEDISTVSGSIERTPTEGIPRGKSTEEMIALLDDKRHRVAAAAELCDRGDARAAVPVILAVKKMSRAEAVRILGKSVKFGDAAAAPLIEGLASSKAFLRHGCALALALLRTDAGTDAVIQLLVDEPTEIWREIARAIGQIGPTALMPLASYVGRLGDRLPPVSDRISWALSHVGVRGGKSALEQMAAGQSVMAPLAQQALTLLENAARDEVRVRPGQPSRDVTVNRQFSRRFFEALESDRPEVAAAALHDLDASGPQELDEADLISEEDEEAELDESDLIQT
jgi:HEAT repeat protein